MADPESLAKHVDVATALSLSGLPMTYVSEGPVHEIHELGAPRVPCEDSRMVTMLALGLNDSSGDADPELESILNVANSVFKAPISMVVLFKSENTSNIIFIREGVGSQRGLYPWPAWRWAFCGWGMWTGSCPQTIVISDATEDARFTENVHVTGHNAWLRFYCGSPLIASNGHHIGTLCILDSKPHEVNAGACVIMNNMAELVVRHLEKQSAVEAQDENNLKLRATLGVMHRALDCFDHIVVLVDTSEEGFKIVFVNEAWSKLTGLSRSEAIGHTLAELMESSRLDKSLFGKEHIASAEMREEFTVKEVLMKGSGTVLELRFKPAESEGLDDDAMLIGVPHCVIPATEESQAKGSPLYFASVRPAAQKLSAARRGSRNSRNSRNSKADEKNGTGTEGLKLRHLVGKGAFGSVYAATWFGSSVAVKVIDHVPGQEVDVSYESSVTSNLRHPHIVATLKTWTLTTAAPPATEPLVPAPQSDPESIAPLTDDLNAAGMGGQQGTSAGGLSDGKPGSAEGPGWAVMTMDPSEVNYADGDDGPDSSALANPTVPAAAAEKSGSNGMESSKPASVVSLMSMAIAEEPKEPQSTTQTWMIMDYCDKGSLQDAIDRGSLMDKRSCLTGKPKMDAILALALQIAGALRYLHSQDVMHGDLSSLNILLSSAGTTASGLGFVAKVADFGLARDVPKKIQIQQYGTITHMPPETLKLGIVSKAVDVYSFGVLLWQMYTATQPWRGMSHHQIHRHVVEQSCGLEFPEGTPQEFEELAKACMAYNPEGRPDFTSIFQMLHRM